MFMDNIRVVLPRINRPTMPYISSSKYNKKRLIIEWLSINFRQDFDSIKTKKLILAMTERGVSAKLIRFIQMMLNETKTV